jgi:hypothetical protein
LAGGGGGGPIQFLARVSGLVNGNQLVCSHMLSVATHSAIAVRIILYDEYLVHVPNGDPMFTENFVYIPFITTNVGMSALRPHISHTL